MAKSRQLKDLGEDALLKVLLAGVPIGRNVVIGPGDDCAAVRIPGTKTCFYSRPIASSRALIICPRTILRVGWKPSVAR